MNSLDVLCIVEVKFQGPQRAWLQRDSKVDLYLDLRFHFEFEVPLCRQSLVLFVLLQNLEMLRVITLVFIFLA